MAISHQLRHISWEEIVPRLPELSGRKLHISWGKRGEARWATCTGVRSNSETGDLFVFFENVHEVVRGQKCPDYDFGRSRFMKIDDSLLILVNSEKDTISFSQLGSDITFFAN